jgi:hypothetical protein
MKFLLIFLIIFLAFTFSLNNLFWYYQLSTRKQVQAILADDFYNKGYQNNQTKAEANFGRLILIYLFFY